MEPNHPVDANTTTTIWRVRLVHAEPGARVVEAICEEGGQLLAMAFGEATTAEVAEDQARRRAAQVLLEPHPAPALPPPEEAEPEKAEQPTISPRPATPPPQPSPLGPGASEPEDWSEDLAVVEVQLQRLGWDRNQESVYLERSFGHMERSNITRYQDLRLYIDALQTLSPPADPCTAPLPGEPEPPPPSRQLLMQTNGTLLGRLGWTTQQGRDFLKRHFGHTSRQSLSDEQMMQFNQQLEALLATGGGDGFPAS